MFAPLSCVHRFPVLIHKNMTKPKLMRREDLHHVKNGLRELNNPAAARCLRRRLAPHVGSESLDLLIAIVRGNPGESGVLSFRIEEVARIRHGLHATSKTILLPLIRDTSFYSDSALQSFTAPTLC